VSATRTSATVIDADVTARFRIALARLNRRLRTADSAVELTESQLFTLGTIEVYGPIRLSDVAARERVSAPTATRLVTSLEERRLIRREINPDDRRSALLVITRLGQATLARARTSRTIELARRLDRLNQSELRRIATLLPILERLASDD
jgi:DNA-binding MarR family transcriptional regulator